MLENPEPRTESNSISVDRRHTTVCALRIQAIQTVIADLEAALPKESRDDLAMPHVVHFVS